MHTQLPALVVFATGIAACCLPAAANERVVRIATGELPPCATASWPDHGMALAVVRSAVEAVGYKMEFTFLPWSRALAETRVSK